MTESFQILATLAAAQIVIALVPGPNTLLVAHAATRSRAHGLAAAVGVWPVGFLWAVFGLTGLGAVFTALPTLAEAMRLACGLYLLWLGAKTVHRSFVLRGTVPLAATPMTLAGAFRAGVITNITNPKSIAYYMSIFAATGAAELPVGEQVLAAVTMPTISMLWYVFLAATVASPPVGFLLDRSRSLVDRIAGGLMIVFGLRLVFGRD